MKASDELAIQGVRCTSLLIVFGKKNRKRLQDSKVKGNACVVRGLGLGRKSLWDSKGNACVDIRRAVQRRKRGDGHRDSLQGGRREV